MRKVFICWGCAVATTILLTYGLTATGKEAADIWENITEEKEPVKIEKYSCKDKEILMRIATAEAGGEGVEGMRKVLEVVLNRVDSPNYPDTIEGVVFQNKPSVQFESTANGRYEKCEITGEAKEAFDRIASIGVQDKDIVAFENKCGDVLNRWYEYRYTVGNHRFYAERGLK